MKTARIVTIASVLAIAACSSSSVSPPLAEHAMDPIALVPARDDNPAPDVFELSLEAREATKAYGATVATPVWTYAGSVPGPLIDAKVGDELVVHFKNVLPDATSIHWHGVRVPASMDGTMVMQAPIPPGGTFDYRFPLKDAGLYWYHPHVQSDVQVHKGLYGAIRVRGANEPVADQELVLMLDDVKLKADGTLSEYLDDASKMMGREGNTLLVNGTPNALLSLPAGGAVRFRLVNAANGRFFNLRLPGHTWRVIGTDGGLLAKPYDTDRLLIAPGERYDVMIVANGAPGAESDLFDDPYDRGHDSGKAEPLVVAHVRFTGDAPLAGRKLPEAFQGVDALPVATKTESIVLNEGIRNGDVVFTVNGNVFPDVPVLSIERGGVRVLDVNNQSEMDHPFHLHGFFFQVLEKNGAPVALESSGNKDTIVIPAKGSLKLLSRFDEPGKWVYHCHILEHAEAGMMGEVDVQ